MIPTHKKVLSEIFGLHLGLGEYLVKASSFDKQQLNQNLFPKKNNLKEKNWDAMRYIWGLSRLKKDS